MEKKEYEVTIIRHENVEYEAVIDQNGKFDGLYPGMPWPSNHGEIKANMDAHKQHGRVVNIIEEIQVSNGMTWARFDNDGTLVWILKDRLQVHVVPAEIVNSPRMARINPEFGVIPMYEKLPYSTSDAHIVARYVKSSAFKDVVQISKFASFNGEQKYVQIILGANAYWIDSSSVLETGEKLPLIQFYSGVRRLKKGEKAVVPVTIAREEQENLDGWAAVKIQGDFSSKWPRKNYEIVLYQDREMTMPMYVEWFGWSEKQNKFSLKSDYTDPTHSRTTVGFELWRDMLQSEPIYSNVVKDKENYGSVNAHPVLLSVDGVLQGVYTLNTYFDRTSMKVAENDPKQIMFVAQNGYENDKHLAFSNPLAEMNSSDFSMMGGNLFNFDESMEKVNRLMTFIHDSSSEEFRDHAAEYVTIQNLIDYYLLVIAIEGYDNLAHNMTGFTYDGDNWFFSILDLDITFGVAADGNMVNKKVKRIFNEKSSPLWEKIKLAFPREIKYRWKELRENILNEENILDKYTTVRERVGRVNTKLDHEIWQSDSDWFLTDNDYLQRYLGKYLAECDLFIQRNFI